MSLTKEQKAEIEHVIIKIILKKLGAYNPETKYMPFHYRLLGRDRMALFSFIHSLNTAFGTSIFEPVAEVLAASRFASVQKQYVVGNMISEQAQRAIQHIMDGLAIADKVPNKKKEVEQIRKVCNVGKMHKTKPARVDLFAEGQDGTVHLFDLKTAKPNAGDFKSYKRMLLEWTAIYLAQHPQEKVASYIAIPYNPYEPKPYERWTLRGMLDLEHELKVADELWDFFGGEGTYEELLACFERAGIELKPEIDGFFDQFKVLS